MNQAPTKKSAALICGALLASVMPMTEEASADPTQINLFTAAFNATNSNVASTVNGVHTFGTTQIFPAQVPSYTIEVTSGGSNRPGWSYELSINYLDYDPGYFIPFGYDRLRIDLGIKPEGTPRPITDIEVKNGQGAILAHVGLLAGGAAHDDGNIVLHVSTASVIAGGNIVRIQWNQIPAPGSVALLGLGLLGARRRRS
jgi:hypothetical protein